MSTFTEPAATCSIITTLTVRRSRSSIWWPVMERCCWGTIIPRCLPKRCVSWGPAGRTTCTVRSAAVRSRARVQRGVGVAVELGCRLVTLGQLTSVVSRGGRSLHHRGACLTSGNSYTLALSAQTVLRSLAERDLDRRELTL